MVVRPASESTKYASSLSVMRWLKPSLSGKRCYIEVIHHEKRSAFQMRRRHTSE